MSKFRVSVCLSESFITNAGFIQLNVNYMNAILGKHLCCLGCGGTYDAFEVGINRLFMREVSQWSDR